MQADAPFRADAEAVKRLWTRNDQGQMVPLAALVTSKPTTGPDPVSRYNGFASADPLPVLFGGRFPVRGDRILSR